MTMETTQILILIIEGLLAIVIAVGGFIVKSIFKRIEALEVDMKGMKDNYLDRFAKVIDNQNEAKETLTKSQTAVKEELIAQQTKVKEELLEHNRNVEGRLITAINDLAVAFAGHDKPVKRKNK